MLLDGRKTDLPTAHCMTLRAIRAKFSEVNIGMAVRAILAHIGEHFFHVALCAGNFFVHSAQGITGLIVVEFRVGTDGPPPRVNMAVVARQREGTMRTSGIGALCRHNGRGQ